jgi:prolyl-tRNA editing enzyme YbaK/EbsC (Cys-tRNA(Pro) deacylase)
MPGSQPPCRARSNSIKSANLKVKSCLQPFALDTGIRLLPNAVHTAQLAAQELGCEIGQIANSLIFRNLRTDSAVLIMSPGGRRVDLQKLQLATGLELGKADAKFVREQTGFAIGGVPPVAHARPLPTFLEISLQNHARIWAAAGTPESIFPMTPRQLQQITGGAWLDIICT